MLTEQRHPCPYKALLWFLVAVLLFESGLFAWSAGKDLASHAKEQALSALLRFLIVVLNVLAIAYILYARYLSVGEVQPANPAQTQPSADQSQAQASANIPRSRGPWHHPLVLLGQAAALPMFFIPIWIEAKSPETDRGDLALLILAILLFLFAVVLLVSALIGGKVDFGWVALGALLPLLGFFQWAYLTFYKPAHEHPGLDVTARLEKVNRSNGVTRLRGVVTVKNNGSARAEVLGAMYTVTRHRMESAEGITTDEVRLKLDESTPNRRQFGKFESLLSVDDLLATGESLAPGETRTRSFVFDARDDRERLVRLTVYLSMSNASGDSKHGECVSGAKPPDVCVRTDFSPSSWAREILGDEPFARTIVHFGPMGGRSPEPPYLSTEYGSVSGGTRNEVQSVDPLIRDQFTQSIAEFRLDP